MGCFLECISQNFIKYQMYWKIQKEVSLIKMSLKKFLHVILNDMQSYTPGRQLYLFLYLPSLCWIFIVDLLQINEFDFICINTCLRISFFDVEGGGFDQTSFFHPCCLICNLSGIVFFFFFFFCCCWRRVFSSEL